MSNIIKYMFICLIFISCQSENTKSIKIKLNAKSDSNASGMVTFTQIDDKVKMVAHVFNLNNKSHAIHLHELADCSSDDGKSTGGHWNPTFEKHGKWGDKEGFHKGDIGNFDADNIGHATVIFETDQWCLGCDDETKNILGKAVIIHEGTDDYTSQPSGAAGKRIVCGGIIEN